MVSRNKRGSKHLSSYTKDQLLTLSLEKQKEWIEKQDWFQKEDFEKSLYDAEITALAVSNLEEDLEDHLQNYEDHGSAWMLKTREFISPARADELEEKGNFTEDEKNQLRECLIFDALDNSSVIQARSLKRQVGDVVLLVTYYGSSHPMDNSILDANFLGVFENEIQVEKVISEFGTVIDNFLIGVSSND